MEGASGANNSILRRAHSEEMLSEIDLNIAGKGTNSQGSTINSNHLEQKKPKSPNRTTQQNGGFSSTELDDEEDIISNRYNQYGQTLCVSDIPRMRRNSFDGGHEKVQAIPSLNYLQHNLNGGGATYSSSQHGHHDNCQQHEFQSNQNNFGLEGEFRKIDLSNTSSSLTSPLATSEQVALASRLYDAGNGCSPSSIHNEHLGIIDIETTQLNPDLSSNDDGDVMMTSSASLQLHHLHQYDQHKQALSASSRPNSSTYCANTSPKQLYNEHKISPISANKDDLISPEKRLDFVVSSAYDVTPTESAYHSYNNFAFPNSLNGCNVNYFSELENSDSRNGLFQDGEISNNDDISTQTQKT